MEGGKAWQKFQAICEAQGGMRIPSSAAYTFDVNTKVSGKVSHIDNRRLARLAKLAGAPHAQSAGIKLHKPLGEIVQKNEPLYTIHAETDGELDYALSSLQQETDIIKVEPNE